MALASLFVFATSADPALSAAIEGETQEEVEEDTRIKLPDLPAADDATIIHIVIDGEEVNFFLQKRSPGHEVCVTFQSDDIIPRSYQSEDEFTELPVLIRTASGQTGRVVNVIKHKLFIDPDEGFDFRLDERFTAGELDGRLVEDRDLCLREDDEFCAGREGLAGGQCEGTDRASASDVLKKMVNVAQGVLVTEAGIVAVAPVEEISTVFTPEEGAPPVTGPTVTGPLASELTPGGGGQELVEIPNLIGKTEAQAASDLMAVGLQLGTVTTGPPPACQNEVNASEVCTQQTGFVSVGSQVAVVLQPDIVDGNEPATVVIFLAGLMLLILGLHQRLDVFRVR